MASRSNFSRSPRHSQLLKRQRSSLVKELPEPAVLLDSPELGAKFSVCDKQEILRGQTQSRRAEKFLDLVELKPPEVFEIFMKLLRTLKPMLADKLEGQFSSEIEGASGSKCKSKPHGSFQFVQEFLLKMSPVELLMPYLMQSCCYSFFIYTH